MSWKMTVLTAAVCLWAVAETSKVITVCEVLANPIQYNGKVIAVRGYLVGTGEGLWLADTCRSHLRTRGFQWPNLIWLAYPGSSTALHQVSFITDREALGTMNSKIRQEAKDPANDRVWVTYVGLLETQENMDLEIYTAKDGAARAAGFGHLSGAPAQLLIKTVSDVVVEHGVHHASDSMPTKDVRGGEKTDH